MRALRSGWLVKLCAIAAVTNVLKGADGVIFYNQISSPTAPIVLRLVNANGTGDQALPVNLPSPFQPSVSRDGRRLLVTSTDPGRPFKISNNVFVLDLVTGALGRTTSYEDEVVLGGVRFTDDLGELLGNQTVSSYKVNFPYYKAFSPDGSQVVVMNQFKSGAITLGAPFDPNALTFSSGRFPVLDVYNRADALPAGAYLFLATQERDGLNQGGDGVDWHPALNEVVAAVASDVSAVGNAAGSGLEGTILAVFSTAAFGGSPFIRKLTNPVGQRDSFADGANFVLAAFTPHDYAPAISPEGTRVAYIRQTLRQDTRFDGAGIAPLPAICAIRIINYDGSGDHEVLRLAEGLWPTRLSWAPDGSEIAFDLAPQAVLNGRNSPSGDASRSEIYAVRADGADPRRVVAGPASFPSWAPGTVNTGPPPTPVVQVRREGQNLVITVDNLAPGRVFEAEGAMDLRSWTRQFSQTASGSRQIVVVPLNAADRAGFYRVRAL